MPGFGDGACGGLRWSAGWDGRRVVLRLAGELDLAAESGLREAASEMLSTPEAVEMIVVMTDVAFMDSTGLRLLGTLRRSADGSGKGFHLASVSAPVRRVLEVAGLEDYFSVVDDPES